MRRFLWLLLLLVLIPQDAHAQASVSLWCWNPTGSSATNNQYVPCSVTNPLQVSSSGGGLASNITQWASISLGVPTGWGVAPSGNVIGTNANVLASVLPTGAATAALQTTGNTTLTTINTTLGSPFQAGGSIGNTGFNVTGTLPAFAATPAVNAQPTPVTSGGLSVYFVQPTASDNHAVIKAGAGQVYKISVTNNSATVNYIRLYNATTGFNGCNSATNLVYENAIPGNTSGTGLLDQWDAGMAFATGISICVTSGYATNDTTNATASALNVNLGYK